MRIRPMLWLALLLTFGVPGASPAPAQDAAQGGTNREAVTRIYKSDDKFVVAVYRADGSAALALVELPKPRGSGKTATKPDMANLMQNGRVIYTVNVLAKDMPGAESTDASASKRVEGKPSPKLTRKQRTELIKEHKASVDMLEAIRKGLATGTVVGRATLDPYAKDLTRSNQIDGGFHDTH